MIDELLHTAIAASRCVSVFETPYLSFPFTSFESTRYRQLHPDKQYQRNLGFALALRERERETWGRLLPCTK